MSKRNRNKLGQFQRDYKILMLYFFRLDFNFRDYDEVHALSLLHLLDILGYNYEPFLVANFTNFKPTETFKRPYLRYLFTKRAFYEYEEHHRVHGTSLGIINFTPVTTVIRAIKDGCYLCKEAIEYPTFGDKFRHLYPQLSRQFQTLVYYSFKDWFQDFPNSFKLKMRKFEEHLNTIAPLPTFKKIFERELNGK